MATHTNLSIYGLYKYRDDIFDDLLLPEELDKDTLIYNLVLDCAEMTLLYPDVNMMKDNIKWWSKARLHVWQRMALVFYKDYDPFINIFRDEEREITQTRDLYDEGTNTSYTNAWNNSETQSGKTDGASNQTGTVSTIEKLHIEGDSAITDAQDVARKEIEMRNKYDVYKYIINDFKNTFCLYIY